MTLVVDASVALKWVLVEEHSEPARALVGQEPLIAPDFLLLECANVLAAYVRRRLLSRESAAAGLRIIAGAGVRLVTTAAHVLRAQDLAIQLGQTVYDSVYVAVALAETAVLVTADRRFVAAVEARADLKDHVRPLA